MRILFMGTPDFAVPCLKVLIESKHEVIGVVTQPDKPKGRGKKVQPTPVKEVALAHDIPVYQPTKARDPEFVSLIQGLNPDLIIVVAFGQILPKVLLDIPPKGCVNVHASLLPKYRGAGPLYWAVINGEKTTGVTTMYMDVGIDTGDMILKSEIPILDEYSAKDVHDLLSHLGAQVLMETVDLIEKGNAPREPQNHEEASHAPMLSKELGLINWNLPARTIFNLVRGTNPWPVAYSFYEGQKMKIYKCSLTDLDTIDIEAGTILELRPKEGLLVATNDKALLIQEVQFEGSRVMHIEDYARGHKITTGTILGKLQV